MENHNDCEWHMLNINWAFDGDTLNVLIFLVDAFLRIIFCYVMQSI